MKFSYIQDWGTYPNETYVAVGLTHKEVLADMKKKKFIKKYIKYYDEQVGLDHYEESSAFVYKNGGRTSLWIGKWSGCFDDYSTLVHETNHLIYFVLGENKGMFDEIEANAYQHQYMFENIAQTLNKAYKRKHLTKKKKSAIVAKDVKKSRP